MAVAEADSTRGTGRGTGLRDRADQSGRALAKDFDPGRKDRQKRPEFIHRPATSDGKEPFDMTNGTERTAIESSQESPAGESVRSSAGCQQWSGKRRSNEDRPPVE